MEDILANVASYIFQKPMDLVINELHYLCCSKSYVENFEDKKGILDAKLKDMEININKARGVSRVKNEAQKWVEEAGDLIKVEIETKKKWYFGLCPNCWWQYRRGKELAEKTLKIEQLLQRCSSNIMAGPADVPGIKYHYVNDFIHFESRKLKFQHLMEALQDENCNVIGLQGMGGVGKTSLAKEVGIKLEEESKFDKVIFLVVSNPPDFKKTRREIARHLGLTLEEGKEEEHSEAIWSRITNMKERLLIILDDVWEEFDFRKDIGIPSSYQHKGCSVLITTRISNVCEAMECQRTIQLKTLADEDALNLFLKHANIHDSSSRLKSVAQNIVKQCGGLPVAIVTVARTLKNQPLAIWKEALKTLKNSESLLDVNGNVRMDYKCLKLSYDNLKNKNAKELYLLCSLFPEDYEIPIEVLSRVGIGAGFFGEVVKYSSTRSKVLLAVQELIDSCLLVNVERECVKMHDLVREVALWIANDIQVIMDSKTTIKPNMRCLFWDTDIFPTQFDGTKLEVSLININTDDFIDLNVPHAFFAEMARLKVLQLTCNTNYPQISGLSLLHSLKSLKDIRSLTLERLKLGEVSILGKLPTLETLELINCPIIKFPEEILELKKLRLLDIRGCMIEMNNPFEVIERCSQLEELYFVDNFVRVNDDVVPQNVSCPTLERYQIYNSGYAEPFEECGSISRFLCLSGLRLLISEAMFKQIVGTAEHLKLGKYGERRCKNLIPDVVSMEDGGMNDLIILYLEDWPDMKCLIDTRNHYSDITAFSNLVELYLDRMDVEALYLGSLSRGFLEQLESIMLWACRKLDILFNGKLNLHHLKAMVLDDCPALTSIFHPFTARSLARLEEVRVRNCPALECIIIEQNSGEIVEENYDSLLPKLKSLEIAGCGKLEMILPVISSTLEALNIRECEGLKYIFGKYQAKDHALPLFPSLKEMELCGVPSLMDICREYCNPMAASMQRPSCAVSRSRDKSALCCFLQKRRDCTSEDTNVAASKERLPAFIIPPGLHASQTFMRQLFNNFRHIKEMELGNFSNFISPFTQSVASSIMWEKLTIRQWDGLKHLIMNEADDHNDQIIYHSSSIFPKIEKLAILDCKDLEFLLPSTLTGGLTTLKSLTIWNAPELKYVVGKSLGEDHLSNQNQTNDEIHFDLPVLDFLRLGDLPKFISIFAMDCYHSCPSLQFITLENCNIKSVTDLMVICSDEGQLNWKTSKESHASIDGVPPLRTAHSLLVQPFNNVRQIRLVKCSNLISLLTLPIASTILLETLTIKECHELKSIVADEGDAEALMNYNSIFPKLKELSVCDCHALEYLFPASVFRSPVYLRWVNVTNAPKLKYLFGTRHLEGNLPYENRHIETYHVDFPALNDLQLGDVPNLVSIYPENYYFRALSLSNIYLNKSPEFIVRSFTDFMVWSHSRQEDSTTMEEIKMHLQILKKLYVWDTKIEEIFNLIHFNRKNSKEETFNREGPKPLTSSLADLRLQNLGELSNICVGPKDILSLSKLRFLNITTCKKLKAVFSASILKSLPKLEQLKISNCKELVHIIEEDYMKNDDDPLHQKPCFPNLWLIHVECCDKLKYLFSISMFGILPNLKSLVIKKASKLEHILKRRGEMKEMAMKDVLPELSSLRLEELPSLVGVCHGIDFQTMQESSKVSIHNCPKFPINETSTTPLRATGHENLDPKVQATKEKLSLHFKTKQLDMGEPKGREDLQTQQSIIDSPNFSKNIEGLPLDTSYPGLSTSTKKAPVVMSPTLTVIAAGGSSSIATKMFKEEKNEEGKQTVPSTQIQASPKNLDFKAQSTAKEKLSLHFTVDQSYKEEDEGRKDLETQQSIIESPNSTEIIEVNAKEGPSLETSYPSLSTSTKKAPILTSPLGGSTPTVTKIFEDEGNDEGEPLPSTAMIVSEQTSETILLSSLKSLKASISHEQTPPPAPTKPTYVAKANSMSPTRGDLWTVTHEHADRSYINDEARVIC